MRNRQGRVAGYGGYTSDRSTKPAPRRGQRQAAQAPRGSRVLAEAFAWLATTAVAGALILLLARNTWQLAVPVVVVYMLFCWLLWQIHNRPVRERPAARQAEGTPALSPTRGRGRTPRG